MVFFTPQRVEVKDPVGYDTRLPLLIGTAKLPGICVFLADKRYVAWARGMEGYVAAAELALCEGPITSVTKVWLDGKLEDSTAIQATSSHTVRFVSPSTVEFLNGVPSEFTVGKSITISGSYFYENDGTTFDGTHKIITATATAVTLGEPNGSTEYDWSNTFNVSFPDGGGGTTPTPYVTPRFEYERTLTSATDTLCARDTVAELALGAAGQTAWSYLSKYVGEYQVPLAGTAHLRFPGLIMPNESLPRAEFEVRGNGATADGVTPGVAIRTLLAGKIDSANVITDVGADGLAASSLDRYCTAMGWTVSAAITAETSTLDALANLLQSVNAIPLWTGDGTLKVIPRGDREFTGNLVTYIPPTTAVALGPNDFVVSSPTEDPVRVERSSIEDTYNVIPVSYEDRAKEYERLTVEAAVASVIDGANGDELRRGDSFDSMWIKSAGHAKKIASILARRSTYIRNVYRFSVSHKGALLEPGDLVTLTESVLGLDAVPARIVTVEEDGQGLVSVEAEEWPGGVDAEISLSTQTADGLYGLPGETSPTAVSFPRETAWDVAREVMEGTETAIDDAAAAQADATAAFNLATDAHDLGTNKSGIFHQATAPTSTVDYTLAVDDEWYSTDATTNCPDVNCKGRALGAVNGVAGPHRLPNWKHRWTGAAWVDAQLRVDALSEWTANIGTVTAGVVQNAGGTAVFDLNNSRITFDNGTVVKVTGLGFGTASQFIEWVGLRAGIVSGGTVSVALCSESNAIQYLKTNGDAYFSGTLAVGTISNSGQTTNTAADASVVLGPFTSNGGAITVAYSLTVSGVYAWDQATEPANVGTYSASWDIALERSLDGSAWTTVATQTITGSQTRTARYEAELTVYKCQDSSTGSGSYTVSNTPGSSSTVHYRLRMTSRTLSVLGVHTNYSQRLSITTQE